MAGDNAEIAFRDYMNANPKAAADYERLKLSLWKKYEHNRDGYTEAKTDFIKQITFLMETDSMKKELQYVTSDR